MNAAVVAGPPVLVSGTAPAVGPAPGAMSGRTAAGASRLAPADATQILLGWQRNARCAARWLHRDWFAYALGIEPTGPVRPMAPRMEDALAKLRAHCDEACSLALLRLLLPAPPTLDALSVAPAVRLDALPIEKGLCVLRMLALIARRGEARRLVDRTTRMRLAQWIGCPLDDLLGKAAPEAPSLADARRERAGRRSLDSLDADELALEGLALLPRTGARALMLRFALPYDCPWHDVAGTATGKPSEDECNDAFTLLRERAGRFFPEYAWLSG